MRLPLGISAHSTKFPDKETWQRTEVRNDGDIAVYRICKRMGSFTDVTSDIDVFMPLQQEFWDIKNIQYQIGEQSKLESRKTVNFQRGRRRIFVMM